MATRSQHDDFGEKIGGAKKDLWKQRGLFSDDLTQMNSREADKYVKKDNVWKKPDYAALIESGTPVSIAYFIKTVRDSLSATPAYYRTDDTEEKRLERQKQYIDTIREAQSVVESIQSKEDALSVFTKFLIGGGYVQHGSSYYRYELTEKGKNSPVITNKLFRALNQSSDSFDRNITKKAEQEQFGVPKEQKVPKGYEVLFNDGKNTYSADDDWRPNTYYVTKGRRILHTNFETQEEAVKWVQDYTQGRNGGKKKRIVPPQFEHIHRDGDDYRHGRDIEGQDYLSTFGFKGGEFGNWMSQNDRQASLNLGFEALKDLAKALAITDADISFGGNLSIAFGARGNGNAVAHYEPMRQVINLTKMRGAGSLAHEWWHGLDDFLGTKLSAKGYLSDNPRVFPLIAQLIDTMKFKPESLEQATMRAESSNECNQKSAEGWLKSILYYSISKGSEDDIAKYEVLKAGFLRGEQGSVEKLSELKKAVCGRVIPKSDRETLLTYERILRATTTQEVPAIGKVATDFYRNSKLMAKNCEKDGGYWDSNVEMTARAFATYIVDKLQCRSDYLIGHAESAVDMTVDQAGELQILVAFPQGEERKAINEVFDKIVAELKQMRIFTHEEKPELSDAFEPFHEAEFAGIPQFEFPAFSNGKSDQLSLFGVSWPHNDTTDECEDMEDEYER